MTLVCELPTVLSDIRDKNELTPYGEIWRRLHSKVPPPLLENGPTLPKNLADADSKLPQRAASPTLRPSTSAYITPVDARAQPVLHHTNSEPQLGKSSKSKSRSKETLPSSKHADSPSQHALTGSYLPALIAQKVEKQEPSQNARLTDNKRRPPLPTGTGSKNVKTQKNAPSASVAPSAAHPPPHSTSTWGTETYDLPLSSILPSNSAQMAAARVVPDTSVPNKLYQQPEEEKKIAAKLRDEEELALLEQRKSMIKSEREEALQAQHLFILRQLQQLQEQQHQLLLQFQHVQSAYQEEFKKPLQLPKTSPIPSLPPLVLPAYLGKKFPHIVVPSTLPDHSSPTSVKDQLQAQHDKAFSEPAISRTSASFNSDKNQEQEALSSVMYPVLKAHHLPLPKPVFHPVFVPPKESGLSMSLKGPSKLHEHKAKLHSEGIAGIPPHRDPGTANQIGLPNTTPITVSGVVVMERDGGSTTATSSNSTMPGSGRVPAARHKQHIHFEPPESSSSSDSSSSTSHPAPTTTQPSMPVIPTTTQAVGTNAASSAVGESISESPADDSDETRSRQHSIHGKSRDSADSRKTHLQQAESPVPPPHQNPPGATHHYAAHPQRVGGVVFPSNNPPMTNNPALPNPTHIQGHPQRMDDEKMRNAQQQHAAAMAAQQQQMLLQQQQLQAQQQQLALQQRQQQLAMQQQLARQQQQQYAQAQAAAQAQAQAAAQAQAQAQAQQQYNGRARLVFFTQHNEGPIPTLRKEVAHVLAPRESGLSRLFAIVEVYVFVPHRKKPLVLRVPQTTNFGQLAAVAIKTRNSTLKLPQNRRLEENPDAYYVRIAGRNGQPDERYPGVLSKRNGNIESWLRFAFCLVENPDYKAHTAQTTEEQKKVHLTVFLPSGSYNVLLVDADTKMKKVLQMICSKRQLTAANFMLMVEQMAYESDSQSEGDLGELEWQSIPGSVRVGDLETHAVTLVQKTGVATLQGEEAWYTGFAAQKKTYSHIIYLKKKNLGSSSKEKSASLDIDPECITVTVIRKKRQPKTFKVPFESILAVHQSESKPTQFHVECAEHRTLMFEAPNPVMAKEIIFRIQFLIDMESEARALAMENPIPNT